MGKYSSAKIEIRVSNARERGWDRFECQGTGFKDEDFRTLLDEPGIEALRELDLSGNQITQVPKEIGKLANLIELHLDKNKIGQIPVEIGKLANLTKLYLYSNEIEQLPEEIGELTILNTLSLTSNRIAQIPQEIGKLTNLTGLYLYDNEIAQIPQEIGKLVNLQTLYLGSNHIAHIPQEIRKLALLDTLDLRNNRLQAIPDELEGLSKLRVIYLHNNPELGLASDLLGPTYDDYFRGGTEPEEAQNILDLYFRAKHEGLPLNEAKLILVGRGDAGKTSIRRRLLNQGFSSRQTKTDGIEIKPWKLKLRPDEGVLLHIWDFGGQEIMHATHQFFLTKRSVYLIVLNGREGGEDVDAEYWLKTVTNVAPESPIIVALNKSRQHPFTLNKVGLKTKYPNILDFIETDCANPKPLGIAELKAAIAKAVDTRLPDLRTLFPLRWSAVKNVLSTMPDNYITFERYREICESKEETDSEAQDRLAGFLHDLGIALNYKDDPRLHDKHVLNPHWVTAGIYKILNAPLLAKHQGELSLGDLPSILDSTAYPKQMHSFLIGLMRKFHLCFPYPGQDDRYLVPELLSKDDPPEASEFGEGAHFRYRYDILPEGLVPRFIVQTYVHSEGLPRWRTGVVLRFDGNTALVKAEIAAGNIDIIVSGPNESRRRLLAVVRNHFEHVHASMKLSPMEIVPIPNVPGLEVTYEELVGFEESHETTLTRYFNGQLHKLDVKQHLDCVDLEGARRQIMSETTDPTTVFVSYSSRDEEHKVQLETHLGLLKRQGFLDTWNMRLIPSGAEFDKVIDERLKAADIIVFLVSADFLNSDYCYDVEVKFAMERHEAKKATVIPIIVRDCDWTSAPFAKLQALPRDAKPVANWPSADSAWTDVAKSIRSHAEKRRL